MDSGDADIPYAFNSIAHRFGCQRCFFGNGNVAGAGRDDRNRADASIGVIVLNSNQTRGFVPLGN